MATLTVYTSDDAGTAVTFAAAAGGGDQMPNNGKTILMVTNGGGGSIDVTVTPQATVFGGYSLANVVVAVAAGATKILGPYAPEYFNNSSGRAVITYSGVTSVTVAALGLP
jgi:hypothetical protein